MKYCIILGTRPEIIKLSPIIRDLDNRSISNFVIHTNQHYNKDMDEIFFKELNLNPPKYNLNIGSGSHGEQTGKMMIAIEQILKQELPNYILVQGDTNTVIAGAMAAAKELDIKIGHVEAGLRSYDRSMPEEINRVIADHISDFLFAPTKTEQAILIQEGIPRHQIHVVGNTIVDAVFQNIEIAKSKVDILKSYSLNDHDYFVLTLHRPANVDTKNSLVGLMDIINEMGKENGKPIIFPCHPRTKKRLEEFSVKVGEHVRLIEPIGYLDMLQLLAHAKLIFTDSGGLQEEACILKIPCITLRENTERPDTVDIGGNILAGSNPDRIRAATKEILERTINWYNPFGDGTTGKKIVDILQKPDNGHTHS
ncbi:MAG: UDP-N-acetylglucosamine 2-epimerase (non-hydrolyzing) [Patescibacteria group bacterium]